MAVKSNSAWVLNGQNGVESLTFVPDLEIPTLGDQEVVLKIVAASLNHREVAIAKGLHHLQIRDTVVPGSDGAGVIEAVGPKVAKFKPGDKACTHLVSQHPESEPVTFGDIAAGLGQTLNGTICQYGVFHESGLVRMPPSLSFLEASTLTCSALTAWNALFGLEGRVPKKGDVVLVQGTGGVSIAALQFARAAGATVIATTSSDEKAKKLKSLGAHHIINYRTTSNWGEVAKQLTPDQKGVHFVIDVGGLSTMNQSVKAVRPEGVIAVTGLLGEASGEQTPMMMDSLANLCIARGVLLGTKKQFEAMNRFIEENGIKPVVDERTFGIDEVKDAYTYLMEQRHFSKVCIRMG